MNRNISCRCVICNTGFTKEQILNKISCPQCGSKSVPVDPDNDVNITINIHELRILGIWAENYAAVCDNKELDNAYHESLKDCVNAITKRIRKQLIALNKDMPLTLSQEMEDLQKVYPNSDLYRNGRLEM